MATNATKSVRSFHARGVLAGAYRGSDVSERTLLTHFYDVSTGHWDAAKTLCNKIASEKLSDEAESDHASCTVCAERFAKLAAKGLAVFTTESE